MAALRPNTCGQNSLESIAKYIYEVVRPQVLEATGEDVLGWEMYSAIGVSVLSAQQEDVMDQLGNHHSDQVDKFTGLDYRLEATAILINNASVTMVVEVLDIYHLPGVEEDNLIYGLTKSYTKTDLPMLRPDL